MAVDVQAHNPMAAQLYVHAKNVFEDPNLELLSLTKDGPLCEKVVRFMVDNQFPFYRHGNGYAEEEATNRVRVLRERLEHNNPFSGYAVVNANANDEVVGLIVAGFDDNPNKIQIAGMEREDFQHHGHGARALGWLLEKHLPDLHKNGYRLPISENGEVLRWKNLDEVKVVAETHPDNVATVHLLENAGFRLVQRHVIPNFQGVHDGRRLKYEIDLYRFIHPDANWLCKWWHSA